MPSLLEVQRAMQRAIVEAAAPPAAVEDAARMAIYRYAYGARLASALRSNYPALARALGDERFEGAANEYARTHPSRHYSIRWHGHRLAGTFSDGRLADLARMEWALGAAFDAADARVADEAFLGTIPLERWEDVALAPHPSVSVLRLTWEVEPHWKALRAGDPAPPRAPRRHPHTILVWRKGLDAFWRTCADAEGRALLSLRGHGTLRNLCRRSSEARARRIGEWFAGWVREGLLAAIPPRGA